MKIYDKNGNDVTQSFLHNQNLLINSDFRNPVNQRNSTSYSVENTGTYQYTIDRWCTIWSANTVSIVDDGVKLAKSGTLIQRLENKLEAGKKYTLSWSVNGVEDSVVITGGDYSTTSRYSIDGDYERILIYNDSDGGVINWAKLEPGIIATPFVPRLFSEELALCQRYFNRITPGGSLPGHITSSALSLVLHVPVCVEMRLGIPITNCPQMNIRCVNGYSSITNGASAYATPSAASAASKKNFVNISYTMDSTICSVNNSPVIAQLAAGNYIDLDAEIY